MDIIYKTFAIYYTMCFMSLNLFFTWVHSPRDNSSAIKIVSSTQILP